MSELIGIDRTALRRYALGDLLAIAVFVILGEISHGVELLGQPLWVLNTAVPFLVGWLIAGPLLGAYARRSTASRWWAVAMALPAWLGADAIGQVLRDTTVFHGSADPLFFLVAASVGATTIAGWRLIVTSWPPLISRVQS